MQDKPSPHPQGAPFPPLTRPQGLCAHTRVSTSKVTDGCLLYSLFCILPFSLNLSEISSVRAPFLKHVMLPNGH